LATDIDADVPVSQIVARWTNSVTGTSARLLIYSIGANGMPGAILLNCGTVTPGSNGLNADAAISISTTLSAGRYFLGFVTDSASAQWRSNTTDVAELTRVHGTSAENAIHFYYRDGVTLASPPDPFGTAIALSSNSAQLIPSIRLVVA
jgi:hypothetical protein